MKRAHLLLAGLLLILTVTLSACGTPSVKNEKEILADLCEQDIGAYIVTGSMDSTASIQSIEILKRQTNPDEKTDYVYVTMYSESKNARHVDSLKLTYKLYNKDGWLLDSWDVYRDGPYSVQPLRGPDESLVDDFFNRFNNSFSGGGWVSYASWRTEDIQTDLESGTASITVSAQRQCELVTTSETLLLEAFFSPALCTWQVPEVGVDHYLVSMTYEWIFSNDTFWDKDWSTTAQLTINNIDPVNEIISLAWETDGGNFGSPEKFSGEYPLSRNSSIDLNYIQESVSDSDRDSLNYLYFLESEAALDNGMILRVSVGAISAGWGGGSSSKYVFYTRF